MQIRISKTMLTLLTLLKILEQKRAQSALFVPKVSKVSKVSIVFEILFCKIERRKQRRTYIGAVHHAGWSRLQREMKQAAWGNEAGCMGL